MPDKSGETRHSGLMGVRCIRHRLVPLFARADRAHRNNISRYRRLLRTKLSTLERQYIERRLSEEEAALQSLSASTFPIVLKEPRPGRPLPTRGLLLVPQDDFTL
ncbi:hypothetical protein AB7008_31380 [Bradyrhizobium sp. 521_C7_N1_3]